MKTFLFKRKQSNLFRLVTPVAMLVGATQLTAAEIEELTVTANMRSESIQDVGISVGAFSESEISEYRLERFWDVANQAPNVDITSFLGNSRPTISIRGGEIQSFSAFDEISVGVYQDGVFLASRSGQLSQAFDLERMEVLRGPQGTLYGRNTPAGAIKYISRKPGKEFAVNGEFGVGNYNLSEFKGGVDIPLSDTLSMRVAGTTKQRDGYVKNIFPSTAIVASSDPILDPNINNVADELEDANFWGMRVIMVWEPSDTMEWVFNIHASDDEGAYPAYFSDLGQGNGEPNISFPVETGGGYLAPSLDGRGDFWTTEVSRTPVSTKEAFGSNLTGTIELDNGWTLTSITAYEKVDSFEDRDTDGTPFIGQFFTIEDKVSQWSQEFRLAGQTEALDWVAGVYYFESNIELNSTLLNGGPTGFGFYWTNDLEQDTESWAAFADLSYAVTDEIDIVGGVRYSAEEKELSGITYGSFSGPDSCCFSLISSGPFNQPLSKLNDEDWSSTLGRLGVEWKVTEDVLVYGGWSRGFRSGGFAGFVVGATSLEPYDEETRDQYEIGIKSSWFDNKLKVNFAAFMTDIEDYQASVTRQVAGATVTRITNAGEVENDGIELEVDIRPVDNMLIRLGLGVVDSVFEDFVFIEDNPATAADETVRLDGKELPAHHPVTFNSVIQYSFEMKNGSTLTPRFEYVWKDEMVANEQHRDPGDILDAYSISNASLRWESGDEKYSVTAWARNVFDKEYEYNSIFNQAAAFAGSGTTFHGPPRTFGVSVAFNFE